MTDTSFLRSDELPGRAAVGYLDDDGLRTNVLHLPVRGNGDGGIYTTAADVHALCDALFAGRIVSLATAAEMRRPRSDVPETSMGYGLGFWLDESTGAVSLHGFDAGVGFVSAHHRERRITSTLLCNQTRGAWPISQRRWGVVRTCTSQYNPEPCPRCPPVKLGLRCPRSSTVCSPVRK